MSHSSQTADHNPTQTAVTVEPDHVEVGTIYKFGIGLTVIIVISQLLMYWMMVAGSASVDASNPPRVYPLAESEETRRPPAPRLQEGVTSDNGGRLLLPEQVTGPSLGVREALKALRDEENQALTSYGWVDRNNQIVRIPIADAIKLTLQRGLPSRGQTAPGAPAAAAPATQERK